MKMHRKRPLLLFISKNKFISVALVIFFVSLLFICNKSVWIFIQNKKVVSYQKIESVESGDKNLHIQLEIPYKADGSKNSWQESDGSWGSQYDIIIYNESDYEFLDWKLVMTVPPEGKIDSSWNATYIHENGTISATGIDPTFTKIVHRHNNVKIGYVLYTNEIMKDSNFYLTGRFIRNPLKSVSFLIALTCFAVSAIVILVSLFFYRMIRRQAAIDNEKIEGLLKLCASFIDTRDEYTKMHSTHVGLYAKKIAEEMGYDEDFQRNIYYMGMMHDVGKVLMPKEILCKAGKLTDEEWVEMRHHTTYGGEILESSNAVKGIREAALHHHERYDGTGYPDGLKGEQIPIQSRIIAVADAYDAMHTNRSYRDRLNDDVIVEELEKNEGIQFDPEVADAMLRLLKKHAL